MAGVVVMSRGSPGSTEGGEIVNAYNALGTPKERVDFLAHVVQTLKDRADSVAQQAVASAQGVDEQYAWAQRQSPPIDLDQVARARIALPRWVTSLSSAAAPPARVEDAVKSGQVDAMVRALGLAAADVLPGAAEPRSGGRRRKSRKTKRKTLRRRR